MKCEIELTKIIICFKLFLVFQNVKIEIHGQCGSLPDKNDGSIKNYWMCIDLPSESYTISAVPIVIEAIIQCLRENLDVVLKYWDANGKEQEMHIDVTAELQPIQKILEAVDAEIRKFQKSNEKSPATVPGIRNNVKGLLSRVTELIHKNGTSKKNKVST